jgi:hypothetical protein
MSINIEESLANINPKQATVCNINREGWVLYHGDHFQGIQCIAGDQTNIMITSSSDGNAYVVLCKLVYDGGQFVSGNVTNVVAIDGSGFGGQGGLVFNHAGGFQVFDDFIIIGVEDSNDNFSKILFYQFGNNTLQPIDTLTILRPGSVPGLQPGHPATAGAVGFSFLGNLRNSRAGFNCMLAVGSWDCNTIDFYTSFSKNESLNNATGFQYFKTWNVNNADKTGWIDKNFANYQSINLFFSSDDKLYMIATHDAGWTDLYRVDIEADENKLLVKVGKKQMKLSDGVDFQCAAGACIVNGKLRVYGAACHSGDWVKGTTIVIEYFDEK